MTLIYIILILIFSYILIKSADMVMAAIKKISGNKKSNIYLLSSILLALGTSFPELFVGITSAIEGSSNLTLGVVLGSNIANIALVGGMTALIAGRVSIARNHLRRDISIALVAGLLPVILILDGNLSRVDGFILLAIYFAYATSFFRTRFLQIGESLQDEGSVHRFLTKRRSFDKTITREYGQLFVGLALLLFSADTVVKVSVQLAESAHIPIFVIGLIVLAAGTSLPEFAFSLRSVERSEQTMFLGNLLGSIIANSTLIIGVSVVISPLNLDFSSGYINASVAFLVLFLLFWYFVRSKFRLERWEAAILIVLYALFVVSELL